MNSCSVSVSAADLIAMQIICLVALFPVSDLMRLSITQRQVCNAVGQSAVWQEALATHFCSACDELLKHLAAAGAASHAQSPRMLCTLLVHEHAQIMYRKLCCIEAGIVSLKFRKRLSLPLHEIPVWDRTRKVVAAHRQAVILAKAIGCRATTDRIVKALRFHELFLLSFLVMLQHKVCTQNLQPVDKSILEMLVWKHRELRLAKLREQRELLMEDFHPASPTFENIRPQRRSRSL